MYMYMYTLMVILNCSIHCMFICACMQNNMALLIKCIFFCVVLQSLYFYVHCTLQVLPKQLEGLKLSSKASLIPRFKTIFQQFWAQNGDNISKLYAGTRSLGSSSKVGVTIISGCSYHWWVWLSLVSVVIISGCGYYQWVCLCRLVSFVTVLDQCKGLQLIILWIAVNKRLLICYF